MVLSRISSSGPYWRQPFAERAGFISRCFSYTRIARTLSPLRRAQSAAFSVEVGDFFGFTIEAEPRV